MVAINKDTYTCTIHGNDFPIQTIATDKAYAAVAFFRADSNSNVCTVFVPTKLNVAPIDQ